MKRQIDYIETELLFTSTGTSAGSHSSKTKDGAGFFENLQNSTELLGIRLGLGSKPLVYNLKELSPKSGKPAAQQFLNSNTKDHYLVVHAISALRTQGKAKVDELQYFATSDGVMLQTIDLSPKTRFNEVLKTGVRLEGALSLLGEFSLNIPAIFNNTLLAQFIDLGPGIQLQLSSSADFIGRFTYSIQLPVVQTSGIGSGSCSWILKPGENKTPLLGDQLLIQSIAVPKGTKTIPYKISGLVKADKGLLWKQQQQQTPEYNIEVKLD